MSQLIPMQGKKYGRLTVLRRMENKNGDASWLCRCKCGKMTVTRGSNLRNGQTSSCGCLVRDTTISRNITHGQSHTKLYSVLMHMISRCSNTHDKYYGGRGISVCAEWRNNPAAFISWAQANGYREDLEIDRIDYNGNYCPDNCRFVDEFVQSNNRRFNRRYKYKGVSYTQSQLARLSGLSHHTIRRRVDDMGMSIEEAVETPSMRKRKVPMERIRQ